MTVNIDQRCVEQEIRDDERRKIYDELRAEAHDYIEKWAPIIGHDVAKADAWNIIVAAERVCKQRDDDA